MSTTVNNPPAAPAAAPMPANARSADSITGQSITETDKNRFANALSTVEQRSKSSSMPADPPSLNYPSDGGSADSGARPQSHPDSRYEPQHDNDPQGNSDDRAEPADGSASVSTAHVNLAGASASLVAGGGFPVSAAGGESALHGALTVSSVAALIERLEARALAAGSPMMFRVLDAGSGITAIQLTQHANGAWQIRLSAERLSRNHLKHYLSDLESGLAARGHRIDQIDLLDSSSSKER